MLWFDKKSISNQHAASTIVCERNHKSIKRYFKETAAKMRPTLLLLYYWTHGSVADKKVEATKLAWLSWWKQSHQCSSLNNQHSFYIKVTSTYIVYYIVLIKESPNGKSESYDRLGIEYADFDNKHNAKPHLSSKSAYSIPNHKIRFSIGWFFYQNCV